MWVFRVMHRYNLVLILQLLNILPDRMIYVQAHVCQVGQEKDKQNKWRWVLPYKDPCKCTSVRFGGLNIQTPARPFDPVYVDNPWVGNDVEKIRRHYYLNCEATSTSNGDRTLYDGSTSAGTSYADLTSSNPSPVVSTVSHSSTLDVTTVPVCMDYLGMKNGIIPDTNIQALSFHSAFPAKNGRLNGTSSWTTNETGEQWIQADIGYETYVSGVITQGDGGFLKPDWVTSFKVSTFSCAYHTNCDEVFVAYQNETVMIFPGNEDDSSPVTALFPEPVYARIVRITCLTRHESGSGVYQLRFEILGCKKK